MKKHQLLARLNLRFICIILCSFILVSCKPGADKLPASDKDNGGLILPGGFEAMVVIDSIGGGPAVATEVKQPTKSNAANAPIEEIKGAPKSNQFSRPNNNPTGNYYGARHIAVNKNGDVYVKLRTPTSDGYGNAALRDLDGDGKMDSVSIWGKYENRNRGTAMQIHNGYLYFTSELMVFRNKLKEGQLVPDSNMDTVVIDTLPYHEHMAKALAFDGRGSMFVSWGMGTNSCQVDNRKPGSPGMTP
jgi:hypothetical protein